MIINTDNSKMSDEQFGVFFVHKGRVFSRMFNVGDYCNDPLAMSHSLLLGVEKAVFHDDRGSMQEIIEKKDKNNNVFRMSDSQFYGPSQTPWFFE